MIIPFDIACWFVSFFGLELLLHRTMGNALTSLPDAFVAGLLAGGFFVILGASIRLHEGRAQLGSFEDVILVGTVAGIVGLAFLIADLTLGPWYRTITAVCAPIVATVLMFWGRGLYRVFRERSEYLAGSRGQAREPVVIIGAGEAARQLVKAMLRDPQSPWSPVALVDDDPLKRHRRIHNVPVVGGTAEFAVAARHREANTAILAIPSATASLVRGLSSLASKEGLTLKVVPSARELLDPRGPGIRDIRDIDVTDLLGRHQVDTDVASIADYLTGKRVLVTGAGGSIGSELCRQIATFDPAALFMLDRDESALHAVELSIYGRAMLDTDDTVLCNIRDAKAVRAVFDRLRPEVVFHAAALKHLPLLEKAPGEAVKTNVWGSLTVLEAAARAGVERFVNVSTDKAANPTSVLGYSKRLAEGLTASVAQRAGGSFLSVRFGNVLGSRGSVLTAFAQQIAAGGPVTVTDPGVSRYFMTIEEAVQLVIQAGAIGRDGEVLVLDMGEPISIDSVARQLVNLSGQDIDIVYTGLRAGEKMHEVLFGDGEPDKRPVHPLISHARVPALSAVQAREMDAWDDRDAIIGEFRVYCDQMAREVVKA